MYHIYYVFIIEGEIKILEHLELKFLPVVTHHSQSSLFQHQEPISMTLRDTEGKLWKKKVATSGNRTRAARVAGEHSTTEPTLRCRFSAASSDLFGDC